MKKFFNLVMAFAATMVLVSSCKEETEPKPAPEPDNSVRLTATILNGIHMSFGGSDTYIIMLSDEGNIHTYLCSLNNCTGEIDENGYVTVPSGTYKMSAEGGEFSIASYAMYQDQSEGADNSKTLPIEDATMVVAEAQTVLTAVIGGVTHVVTYNGPLSMPADLPEPDVDFVASRAQICYIGTTSDENEGRFKVFLSDIGLDEEVNAKPNGRYYMFTLCVNKLDPTAEIAIPAGKYEVDNTESSIGYISKAYFYQFGDPVSEVVDNDIVDSGYFMVNEDGTFEASFKMFSQSTHTITFSGEVETIESTIPSEAPYSQLTSNKVCDLSNHSVMHYREKEVYGDGYVAWVISINSNGYTGDNIAFTVLCGKDENANLSGKYTVSDSMEEFTVLPGYIDGFTLMDSWYYHYDCAMLVSEYAPVVKGWVEIQYNENGIMGVSFDVYDDLNNNITGSWSERVY